MAENGVMEKHREPKEAVSGVCTTDPHWLLYPIADRLEAIKELIDTSGADDLELLGAGRRGLALLIGDISARLNEVAGEIEGDFLDLKKHGASAGRLQAQNGKGSPDACGQASSRLNLAKAGGGVN